jgi:hypothetical protein
MKSKALDFLVPRRRRVGVTFAVQAAGQLAGELRPLLGRKPEELGTEN